MGSASIASPFLSLSDIPLDPHYALKELFLADDHPKKVLLGSGVYRDNDAKPWVLPVVEESEMVVEKAQDSGRYEYLGITGHASFCSAARDLLFGPLHEKVKHVVSLQTISGTGANYLGAQFLWSAMKPSAVWISDPSWVNHSNIWSLTGVKIKSYPYWNREKKVLDFGRMIEKLRDETAPGDVIVLHACAHNPTGVDPTKEQWKVIADVCEEKKLFPFFDSAYQGFASGDLDEDAWALRHFVERGTLELAAAQSFSKNMGLYGERTGALHLLTNSIDAAAKAKGHLAQLQRGQISQPPRRGCTLATAVLADSGLFLQWLKDLEVMSSRIRSMREALRDELIRLETPGNWDHIVSQIGMFSYTGLTPEQVAIIQADHHVYILKSGRISVAGLNTKNVKYVAEGIDAAVRKSEGQAQ